MICGRFIMEAVSAIGTRLANLVKDGPKAIASPFNRHTGAVNACDVATGANRPHRCTTRTPYRPSSHQPVFASPLEVRQKKLLFNFLLNNLKPLFRAGCSLSPVLNPQLPFRGFGLRPL